MDTSIKTCFKCGQSKPLSEFYKHPQTADGYLNKCKDCTKADVHTNRRKNIVYYRSYDRKRAGLEHRVKARAEYEQLDETKEKRKRYQKTYKGKHKHEINARAAVYRNIKNGLLVRLPCEICGNPDSEAHHEDYSKPLDVIWLCSKHHAWIHK